MILGIVASGQMTGGGGGGVAPTLTDYFAADGASQAIHGVSTYPAAFYDASSDTTWVAWEGWLDASSQRLVQVTTYDHATSQWGAIYSAFQNPLTDESHGVPAICMDHQGYVHVFYGVHDSNLQTGSTASANDPSTWVHRGEFTGEYTYPHPHLVGSTLYLFAREIIAPGDRALVLKVTSALSGGVPTWGADQSIVSLNGGSGARVYLGASVVSGTDIHLCWTRADNSDTIRQDIYHAIYDTTDGSLRNSDGSTDTAAGSLPINLATANASYRVVEMTTTETGSPGFCIGSDGDLHIVYTEGTEETSYNLKYITFDGISWSSPEDLGAIAGTRTNWSDSITLVPIAAGDIELWYPSDPTDAWTFGGNIVRRIRTSGTWGSASTILSAGTSAIDRPHAVRNADADLRVLFAEVAQDELDANAGDHKMYAYGSAGYVQRGSQAPTAITLSSTTVVETAIATDTVGTLRFTDPDVGDTVTWSITSDPSNKFDISGNELVLTDTVSAPTTYNVTVRATDSFGHTKDQAFTITAVAAVEDLTDPYLADVALLVDTARPVASGTDASIASVVLLMDFSE